jgi:hypothetical protein
MLESVIALIFSSIESRGSSKPSIELKERLVAATKTENKKGWKRNMQVFQTWLRSGSITQFILLNQILISWDI